jgi:type 1 glutamine amidotransferase
MRRLLLVLAACLSSACGSEPPLAPGAAVAPLRVLMVTATAAFRHDSIPVAVAAVRTLGSTSGEFTVTQTEDLNLLSAPSLAGFDVVMFALTSGELALSAEHKRALVAFVDGGRGFIGIHSATDTLYEWPEYARLVGTHFREHPWTQQGIVEVEDASHPATRGLNSRFAIFEEFYTFRDNPRGRVQVLLRLDAASVGASGDYPLAWAHAVGAGRAYYNALGHFPATWSDPQFRQQLAGAIRWTGRR